jgi:putative proteasome-type protease
VTYCVGVLLDDGLIFASDSRTNAGLDNIAKFSKMTVFERPADRVIVLLSSGNLAGTQAVIGVLNQRCASADETSHLWNAPTMFDVAMRVADAMRSIEQRDGAYLQETALKFNASFIVGGQIQGEPPRLFRIYAEGNFIEAGTDTPYLQTGETKYGKPIIDRVITRHTPLAEAAKCARVVRFDDAEQSLRRHADRSHLLRTRQSGSEAAAFTRATVFQRAQSQLGRERATRVSRLPSRVVTGAPFAFLITCEHGGNRSRAYQALFHPATLSWTHTRSYDPSARASEGVGIGPRAPLVGSTVSRLLVDLNRSVVTGSSSQCHRRAPPRATSSAFLPSLSRAWNGGSTVGFAGPASDSRVVAQLHPG